MELAMYIAAYCDWGIHRNNIPFFYQDLSSFVAEFADLGFGDQAASAKLRNRPDEATEVSEGPDN
jgi:hypothetical protein